MHSFTGAPRSIAVAATGVALLAGVVGCSSAPTGTGTGDSVNLSLQIWDPAQTPGVQKAVDAFEETHANIDVTLERMPEDQYYTKLDASLGAGEGPDVMWQSSRAAYYVEGGALEPLDEYIARDDVSLDDYPSQLAELYNFDGQQYGMPYGRDVWTFVYNAEVFERLGVTDVPALDWTWDDMVRIAEELRAADPSLTPLWYGFGVNVPVSNLIEALGGDVVVDGNRGAVSSPEGIEALEMVKDLQDRGLIPAVADSADFNAVTSLISGNTAIARIPSHQLPLLSEADAPEGTFHVLPTPAVNGSRASDTNGLSYVMNANSSHKDEAWELIRFLTSDEGARLHVEEGAMPAANNAEDVQQAYVDRNAKLAGLGEAFEAATPDQFLRPTTQFPPLRSVFPEVDATIMGPFYTGAMSTQEAAQKIDELVTAGLE